MGPASRVGARSSYLLLLLSLLAVQDIARAECAFPTNIRGVWVRGRGTKLLTFTESEVTGLDVRYNNQDLGSFSCRLRSGVTLVIASQAYNTTFEDKRYYLCWRLVEVTQSAYFLYELSDPSSDESYHGEPGIIVASSEDASVTLTQVCNKEFDPGRFTTILKRGAEPSALSRPCPSQIVAKYTYGPCQLDLCGGAASVRVNYSACPDQIFHSASGVLSCMGHVSRGANTYLSLVRHDADSDVICFNYSILGEGVISGEYYMGGCSNTAGTPLTLTKTEDCDQERSSNSPPNNFHTVIATVIVFVTALCVVLAVIIVIRKKMTFRVTVPPTASPELDGNKPNLPGKEIENTAKSQVTEPTDGGVPEPTDGGVTEPTDGGVIKSLGGRAEEPSIGEFKEPESAGVKDQANGGVKGQAKSKFKDTSNADVKDHLNEATATGNGS